MTSTTSTHTPFMTAFMWSDYNGELTQGENLLTSFATSAPRRYIPCVFRSQRQIGEVLYNCGVTLEDSDIFDDDSDDESSQSESESDAALTDENEDCAVEFTSAAPIPSVTEDVPAIADTPIFATLKRKLDAEEEAQVQAPNVPQTPSSVAQENKRQRVTKLAYQFTADDDTYILQRLTQGTATKSVIWKELSEKFECSLNHLTKHYDDKLKCLVPPSMGHLSAVEKDEYIKKTVKRWGTDETKHHWKSLAERLGSSADTVQARWEELKSIEIATRVQRKKNVRQVVPADDRIYSAVVAPATTASASSSSSSYQTSVVPVAEPELPSSPTPAPQDAPEASPTDVILPNWYYALAESQQSNVPFEEDVVPSSPVASKMDVEEVKAVHKEAPTPTTPTRSPYESQEDTLGAEYWRNVATARDRDAYIMSELKRSASMQDCARLAALFGWSIEAVKGRWRQLNPNRWQASPGKPKPKARNLGFGLAATRIGAPKVSSKQNKSAEPRVVLSSVDKDAILIRTVRTATATACPVNWKYLSTIHGCGVDETKLYYGSMNIAKRICEIIHVRVRGHNAPLCDKLWRAVNLELGIENAAEVWEEIAVRESVCRDCGWQPCSCAGSVQAVQVNNALVLAPVAVEEAAVPVFSNAELDVVENIVESAVEPFVIDLTDD